MNREPRILRVAAGQLGPIAKDEPRSHVVDRMLAMMREASAQEADLIAFPELALTTFFPRWHTIEVHEHDHYYETEMPGPETKRLFDEAALLGLGFSLGYAELTPKGERFNTTILVDGEGNIVSRFRKVHIPGHEDDDPSRPFQHLERRYFQESQEGFHVHRAFGGLVGMATCNDRRWPESYREMGLQGVELILIGYNTPIHYPPDPSQNALQGFHNHLVMQAGAYQNGTWVVGVAKGGIEEGIELLAQSAIIAPSGQIVAQAMTIGDEVIVADCDLDWCKNYTETLFNFDTYRRPEMYGRITGQKGVVRPE